MNSPKNLQNHQRLDKGLNIGSCQQTLTITLECFLCLCVQFVKFIEFHKNLFILRKKLDVHIDLQ